MATADIERLLGDLEFPLKRNKLFLIRANTEQFSVIATRGIRLDFL